MPKTAELELVTYRTMDMYVASERLVDAFTLGAGVDHAQLGNLVLRSIETILEEGKSEEVTLHMPGLSVTFEGKRVLPMIRDGRLLYASRDPRFILEKDSDTRKPPEVADKVDAVAENVIEMMARRFKLVAENSGTILNLGFPREYYASSVKLVPAPILDDLVNPKLRGPREEPQDHLVIKSNFGTYKTKRFIGKA